MPGEFELIARYFAPLATEPGALGLKDDVALLRLAKKHELVAKTDAIVEGVHFLRSDPPDMIAQKALRVNLSDLAAKGAKPLGYLMSLSLPPDRDASWIRKFASGLGRDQRQFDVSLLGGDTTRTNGALTIAITALGAVPTGKATKRRGARPGDKVFVTGTLGDAAGGLDILMKRRKGASGARELISRYRLPRPRLDVGRALLDLANASIDVSDGLMADLGHIAEVSRVRIVVDAWRVPLSAALRRRLGSTEKTQMLAATSGDDYEIAFTCPGECADRIGTIARKTKVAITEIGRVVRGRGVGLLDARGRPIRLKKRGYAHF